MPKISQHPGQGVLQPSVSMSEKLNAADGIVRVEDLDWPFFDLEQPTTMPAYVGQIGVRMAETPRDNSVTDSALELYRSDFEQAEPGALAKGLYFPSREPRKSVIRVAWQSDWRRADYPGQLPFSTGLAVSEDVYEEVVKNADFYANQIDNRTQRANLDEPIVEARCDIGGESVVYAFVDKHQKLEDREALLLGERAILAAVQKSVTRPSYYRPVERLEPYRLQASEIIQDMARIACKSLGYGTNQTRNTLRAIASNLHRSPEAAQWWRAYLGMALQYNEEVRGKVQQSIHGCVDQIGKHRGQLIHNLDREYED